MWWMILLLLMLAIAALLWWRGKQEREWRLELAYLSRHAPRADTAASKAVEASATPPSIKVLRQISPNLTNVRLQTRASQANQAVLGRVEAQMQQVNPRFKAAAALTEADKARLASDEVLAELPIFAHALSTETPVQENEAVENAAEMVASMAASDAAIPMFEHVPEATLPKEANANTTPATPLEVITLAEATRKVATRTPESLASTPPLETVELNWPPVDAAAAKNTAVEPAEVITLADPAVSRIRERTLAERETLAVAVPAKPAAAAPAPLPTIGEDDIRSNLLRQRLARRREHSPHTVAAPIQPELAVIAEDEVLANLAKTDSPVNKPKHQFKRTTVRESVIPAAARIGHSHAVKLSPLSTALAAEAASAPISTRFTPYESTPEPAPVVPAPVPPVLSMNVAAIANTPTLHITDAPTWSISDRLMSESDAPLVPVSTEWPQSGSHSAALAPVPPQPAWQNNTTEPTPAGSGRNVWGQRAAAHAHTLPENENIDAPPPLSAELADEDIPEWQQTLNEAMAMTPSAVPAPPPTPPAAAQPAPQTAIGMALQSAMQHAPPPSPAVLNEHSLPGLNLLLPPQFDPGARQTEEALLENGITIEEKLAEFKVKVSVVDAYAGPVITRYEIEPAQGVRGNQVVNLEKDLARSLGFAAIRVVETIPGKTCMGLELPNPKRQMIRISEIFSAPAFQESRSKLTLALGQDITGAPVVTDLARAPHLLVAGTTGSGKSVGVNAMILSMLFKATPEEVRMIMIDPKMLELSIYEGIPHLLAPVVTDMKLAANALTWCVNEMEKRYRLMSHMGVRNLAGFNQKVAEAAQRGHKLANPFSLTPETPEPLEKLPFIVVVVDEFADLMMTAGKKIEELIARLAQKARAAGIHLILATQRPSVDVITGLIKANIPTLIAFQVSSKIDSRTILDQMGAENLLGQGDMLFLPPGTGYPRRIHGAFVADEEVHGIVEYLKQFGEPDYIDDILTAGVGEDDLFSNANGSRNNEGEDDPLYDEAVAVVVKTRKASISSVQRQLRIGYNRAARLVEQMEADGIVSAAEGNGNRTVLAPSSAHLDE